MIRSCASGKCRLFGALLLVPVLLTPGCSVSKKAWWNTRQAARKNLTREGRYNKTLRKAYRAGKQEDLELADRLYLKARKVHPERPGPAYAHALILARQERDEAFWRTLEEAAELGYTGSYGMKGDKPLERYREDPRFEAILARVEANVDAWVESRREAHEPRPWSSAQAFGSYAELKESFSREKRRFDRERRKLAYEDADLRERRLRMRKLAALERYIEEHPDAGDREDAALSYVRNYVDRAREFQFPWEIEPSLDFGRAAGTILAEYPESEHRSELAFYRAVGPIVGATPMDYDWENDPDPELNCDGALERLEPLAEDPAEDLWAGAALAFKALCLYELDPENEEPVREAYTAHADLPEPGRDRYFPFRLPLRNEMKMLTFRVDGPPEFIASTLEGEEMTLERLRGKHVLMEFWGPT